MAKLSLAKRRSAGRKAWRTRCRRVKKSTGKLSRSRVCKAYRKSHPRRRRSSRKM
jgi:hypothetical protein